LTTGGLSFDKNLVNEFILNFKYILGSCGYQQLEEKLQEFIEPCL